MILAQESSLVECVLVRQVARLGDLVLSCVEDVAALRRSTVFFASKDKDVSVRDWAGAKPVLDVCLEG